MRLEIESFSHECRGVAHLDGKTIFVDGALPGEVVMAKIVRRHRRFDDARVEDVLQASANRVEPLCPWFSDCGGCALQHLAPEKQIELKQEQFLHSLKHLGQVTPKEVIPPLTGDVWNYRYKARLGVRNVIKKGRVLVGFREKFSGYLTVMDSCPVLHSAIADQLKELADRIIQFRAPDAIAQIELAAGDQEVVAVFRHLEPLNETERQLLREWGDATGIIVYLQPEGVESMHPLDEDKPAALSYALPAHQVEFRFQPADFTQINPSINRQMVDQAIALLNPQPDEILLDLFCGLGNFTLPFARCVQSAVGIDGDPNLISRAGENALENGIDNVTFLAADLTGELPEALIADIKPDIILIDPPRSGALEVLPWLGKLKPRRILYVSCNPATFARDAGVLVNEMGYRLKRVGIMDMFPHTTHVESMALFSQKGA